MIYNQILFYTIIEIKEEDKIENYFEIDYYVLNNKDICFSNFQKKEIIHLLKGENKTFYSLSNSSSQF